jgi:hypothetical protein
MTRITKAIAASAGVLINGEATPKRINPHAVEVTKP